MHLKRSWPAVSHLEGGGAGTGGEAGGPQGCAGGSGGDTVTYSQLQAEGHPQHLEPLHLEIHPDGRLVVLIEGVFAKAGGGTDGCQQPPDCPPPPDPTPGGSAPPTPGDGEMPSTRVQLEPSSAQGAAALFAGGGSVSSLAPHPPPRISPGGVFLLPVDQAGLPHREVPHHDDLGDLEPAGQGDARPLNGAGGGSLSAPLPRPAPRAGGFVGWRCVGVSPRSPPPPTHHPVSSSALQPVSPTPLPAAARTPAFPPRCIPAP